MRSGRSHRIVTHINVGMEGADHILSQLFHRIRRSAAGDIN